MGDMEILRIDYLPVIKEYIQIDGPWPPVHIPDSAQRSFYLMKQIQKLGKEGWELVSMCPTSSSEYGLEILTAFLKKEIS
jgi:hypothetical protein